MKTYLLQTCQPLWVGEVLQPSCVSHLRYADPNRIASLTEFGRACNRNSSKKSKQGEERSIHLNNSNNNLTFHTLLS